MLLVHTPLSQYENTFTRHHTHTSIYGYDYTVILFCHVKHRMQTKRNLS